MNDLCSCIGQKIDTLDEVERFYRDYGKRIGFVIIIRNTHRRKEIFLCLYICRKGGRESSKTVLNDNGDEGKRTRDKFGRTNCEARMYVVHNIKSNKWEVTLVKLEKNHSMMSLIKVQSCKYPKIYHKWTDN